MTTIAVAAPLTGDLTAFGEQVCAGVRAALADRAEVTAESGAIDFVCIDDACHPSRAIAIARELVASDIVAVIGHVCSNASIAAAPIYAEAAVPMLTPASSSDALTNQGFGNVFRVAAREGLQAELASRYIAQHFAGQTTGIVHEDDLSGTGHASRVVSCLAQLAQPTLPPQIAESGTLAAIAAQLLEDAPGVVFYGGHDAALLGQLILTLRRTGYAGKIVSNDGAQQARVWEAAAGHAEGLCFAFEPDYRKAATASRAVSRIRSQGAEPDGFTINGYVCAQILGTAIAALTDVQDRLPDRMQRHALCSYLHYHAFATARGNVRFDAAGEIVDVPGALFIWRNGAIEEIDAFA